MEIRNINWPEEKDAIAEHIRLVHGPGDEDFLMKWYGAFPGFDPANSFVIEGEAGEIAAHTMIIPRTIQLGNAHIPVGEVGVVGTLDTYRGQGYAHALMDRVLDYMTERGDALGLIFGIPNFYEKWEFEYATKLFLTSYESYIDLEQALTANAWDMAHSYHRRTAAYLGMAGKEVLVRAFYNDDMDAVQALYDAECAKGRYIIGRDAAVWHWQLEFLNDIGRYDPDDFLVAEIDGKIAGYVRMVSRGQVNWFLGNEAARFSIIESAGDDADATEALLRAVADLARDYDVERIGVYVHPESQMMKHVLAHGGIRRDFTGAAFLRMHNLPLLMGLLTATFEQRLARSPFSGRSYQLHMRSEQAEMSMPLGYGDANPVEAVLEAPAIDLVRLATGWFTVDDLTQECYDERHRDLWRVLFPKQEAFVALADIL